ncbi:unnamed protein product [Effrenium voratum]|nr:unnamed protein product [Effrenium voratum]
MAARVLVRIRHVCGPVSASVAVVPQFLPPEMLSARLLVQDAGLAIQLMARSCSSEQCHAAVLQFKVRAESSKGSREAQKMLQERSIVGKAASIEDQQFIVDIEELGMLSDQEQVAFCARIGDSCRKSDWSSEQQLKLRVPAPRARGALTVCQLGPGVAEVLWPLFEPAAGLKDVHYEVTATCSCFPEERQQLTIPAGGPGHAVLSGLVADTDYVVKVRGRYPWLGRFQDEGGSNIALKAHFRTLGVDTEDCEPPLAVRQVAPPADHGGVDLRSPWSSEFWLEVDPRALGETATHRVEWRPAILRGLDRQGGWQTAAVRSQGKCGKAALCTWDLEDLKDLEVEAVEFRCRRLQCEDSDGLLSSRTWVSRSSGPFATGFAAPEKPKALLAGRLELVLSFALRTELLPKSAGSGVGALEPEPESRSPGHGHRLATRMQLCCRQAGDAHEQDDVQEFPARVLPEAEGSNGWRLCTVTIPVRQPQFREGQRQLFAVRVGDSCRWSAWSGFSKPVHMTAPALQPPQASLTVTPLPPARVRLQWPCFSTDFGDAVEYFLSLAQVGPAGREVKASSQLIALVGETDASSGNVMEVEVGHMDAGTPLQFKVLARAQCHLLGAPQFAEVARSEVMWPPTPGPLSDLAPESWDLPAPKVLPVPEGLEAGGGRWRGRAALLSWPWGVEISEDPPLELQACNVLGDVCHAYAWTAVTWSLIYLNARPCVAASPLPFARCRFRWYSVDRRIAGPCSEPCLTYVDTPTEVAGEVFCTVAAVRVRASFVPSDAVQNGELLFGQWRCGRTARRNEDGEEIWSPVEKWHVLDQKHLTVSTETESLCHSVFGEEEGLELGAYYVLSVRVGDGRRFSSWSAASPPVLFDVPEADNPVPSASEPHMGKLLLVALDGRSARCWWPLVQAPEMPIGGSARGRPTLEYRLDVSRCLPGGGMERHCTVLLADEEREDLDMYGAASLAPCEARVNGLQPGGQYFASLAVRFALLGRREWRRTGITATFQTV